MKIQSGMSGHSKWHQIKHQKAVTDSRKSRLFSKLAQDIAHAARHGHDPATNALLRDAIARAKKANVPQSTIDRILQAPSTPTTAVLYEGFGPAGVALLISSRTDNANRTVSELKSILKKHGGRLGSPGSTMWKFIPTLAVTIPRPGQANHEALTLQLIEAGAGDIQEAADHLTVDAPLSARPALEQVLAGFPALFTTTYRVAPANQITAAPAARNDLAQLQQSLLDHPDVDAVHTDAAV